MKAKKPGKAKPAIWLRASTDPKRNGWSLDGKKWVAGAAPKRLF